MSIEAVIAALHAHKVHRVAPGRYRAICPVCGENNASALSIGEAQSGAALIRCFKSECSVEDICAALGMNVADLFPPRERHQGPMVRRRLLSASQALDLLHDEAQLVAMSASNVAHGVTLSDDDRARVLQAAGRVAYLRQEVLS